MVYTGIVQRVGMARYSWRTHQLEVRAPGFFERTTVGDSHQASTACASPVTFADDVACFGVTQEEVTLVEKRAGWTRCCTGPAGPRRPGAG
jgi:riboflavin synthase alpha subunit